LPGSLGHRQVVGGALAARTRRWTKINEEELGRAIAEVVERLEYSSSRSKNGEKPLARRMAPSAIVLSMLS
jgi:hypothetical protein